MTRSLELARKVYDTVYARGESSKEDQLGADLAYLLVSIIDGITAEFGKDRPIVKILLAAFPTAHPVWQFVTIVHDETAGAKSPRQALTPWLERVHAEHLWTLQDKDVAGRLDAYEVNGRMLIVQRYNSDGDDEGGWEIYAPVCTNLNVAMTLEAAERHCGLRE